MGAHRDKAALITGAGRGIGKAVAARLAREGAAVGLMDVDAAAISAAAAEISSAGGRALAVVADVSDPAGAKAAVSQVVSAFGSLDVLVNNAGIVRDRTLLKLTEDDFDRVIAVNLKGVYLMGRACAEIMAKRKYGKIVNLSSMAGSGNYGQTNYSAAKAGVIGMTKTWALELSRFNINVNAVAPGLIRTDMTSGMPPAVRSRMIDAIPLRRMGEAEEVAALVCFLASDEASYIQGEVIAINGGLKT